MFKVSIAGTFNILLKLIESSRERWILAHTSHRSRLPFVRKCTYICMRIYVHSKKEEAPMVMAAADLDESFVRFFSSAGSDMHNESFALEGSCGPRADTRVGGKKRSRAAPVVA